MPNGYLIDMDGVIYRGSTLIPGAAEFLAADGTLRTLPCHWNERGGLDGFYVARFRRR